MSTGKVREESSDKCLLKSDAHIYFVPFLQQVLMGQQLQVFVKTRFLQTEERLYFQCITLCK